MATFSFLGLQYAAWTTAVAPLPEENNIRGDTNQHTVVKPLTSEGSFYYMTTHKSCVQCENVPNLNRNQSMCLRTTERITKYFNHSIQIKLNYANLQFGVHIRSSLLAKVISLVAESGVKYG